MIPPVLLQPFRQLPLPSPTFFAHKTAIVTGSNTGLGLSTARHLLAHGAENIILAVRNSDKGLAARSLLLASHPTAHIEFWDLDQSSFSSVLGFSKRAKQLETLDYLFLNAGVLESAFHTTPDGWESTLQVNVLSPTLLALLLLPKMSRQDSLGAIVNVSSTMHEYTRFPQRRRSDGILRAVSSGEEGWTGGEQYAVSKLLGVFAMRELAKLVPTGTAAGPVVNCADPGWCDTDIQRTPRSLLFRVMMGLLGRTAEMGARSIVAGATLGRESHGGYIASAVVSKPGGFAVGPEATALQGKVWQEILDVLKRVSPEIQDTLEGRF